MSGSGDQNLDLTRKHLVEQATNSDKNLAAALDIFKIARDLVPLPVLINSEPSRYSTSTSNG